MSVVFLHLVLLFVGLIFLQTIHPLIMGVLIVMQTLIICFIIGICSLSFWYSYVLFLVYLGGLLVLFIYVSSLVSNEEFENYVVLGYNFLWMMGVFFLFITIISFDISFGWDSLSFNLYEDLKIDFSSSYFYSKVIGKITIFLGLYLLLCLFAVTKICQVLKGPMRQSF